MNWLPMSSAPMDGTVILVTETPNGEHWNVMPAAYMNYGGGDPNLGEPAIGCIGWFAVWGSGYSGEGGHECNLPVRWKSLVITPLCWMPLPEAEPVAKLRRRAGQIYARKAKKIDNRGNI